MHFYRQLVSRCEIKIQILVVQVLKLVIEGMRENFNKIAHGSIHNVIHTICTLIVLWSNNVKLCLIFF